MKKKNLRSKQWFNNPKDPEMTALYLERYLVYSVSFPFLVEHVFFFLRFFETLILIAIIAYIYSSYSISSSGFVSIIPELGILTVTALRIYPSINKIIP